MDVNKYESIGRATMETANHLESLPDASLRALLTGVAVVQIVESAMRPTKVGEVKYYQPPVAMQEQYVVVAMCEGWVFIRPVASEKDRPRALDAATWGELDDIPF